MNLHSKMFADVHDLPWSKKKSDSRPYKVSPNTDVSAAEIGQICWLIVDLYISSSHLYQNKGNLDLISFIFDRNFSVFCPKRMVKKNGFNLPWSGTLLQLGRHDNITAYDVLGIIIIQ